MPCAIAAMFKTPRFSLLALLTAAAVIFVVYQGMGTPKPIADWDWIDIASEGGNALMTAVWGLLVLGTRPRGRVTAFLAGGLLTIALGSWADCLDEFFAIPHHQYLDNWIESGFTLSGMFLLTWGIYLWRDEQFSLAEHMQKRERLFRDHRAFDRLTQLANADYLRRQICEELSRRPGIPCALLLLDIDGFHRINRQYGQREGDDILQALTHLFLLNLRRDDLLCRYAGDRYAVLLPNTSVTEAALKGRQLAEAVGSLSYHGRADGQPIPLSIRVAWGPAEAEADALLARLNAQLEQGPGKQAGARLQTA